MMEGSKAIRANLKEGMLIGEDNGAKGWDAGRHKGIDHITQTVKDPKTGKLMISESQGGKGVTLTDPEEYFAKKEKKGVKLFGTDMTAMDDGCGATICAGMRHAGRYVRGPDRWEQAPRVFGGPRPRMRSAGA